jgi:hypothetical protein
MMQIINRPRQAGKTYELLRMMSENEKLVMVCGSRQSANEACDAARRVGFNVARERFIDPGTIVRGTRRGRDDLFVVDDLEFVLRSLLGGDVHAVAANAPEPIVPWYLQEEDEANR